MTGSDTAESNCVTNQHEWRCGWWSRQFQFHLHKYLCGQEKVRRLRSGEDFPRSFMEGRSKAKRRKDAFAGNGWEGNDEGLENYVHFPTGRI